MTFYLVFAHFFKSTYQLHHYTLVQTIVKLDKGSFKNYVFIKVEMRASNLTENVTVGESRAIKNIMW
jgi:hypothetical protein